ncbi:MAG: NAD(P)H-hydrate dehydratase [Brevinematales bacterium]|nr:NAD(P)H-hydrate dehydratase [Brevinematales bacterium]
MKILSTEDAKFIDITLSNSYSINELVLMENAGNDVYHIIKSILGDNLSNYLFLVFCGVGNNGGDGLVVSRKLLKDTNNVFTFIIGDVSRFTNSAKTNYKILSKITNNIWILKNKTTTKQNKEDHNSQNETLSHNNISRSLENNIKNLIYNYGISLKTIVIDALVGIGIKQPLREPILSTVRFINSLKERGAIVFSIDVPSGFIASLDKGDILSTKDIVNADYTITFFSLKAGMFLPEIKQITGQIIVSTLGFREEIIDSISNSKINYLKHTYPLPKRPISNNKSSNGRVIVVGGSDKYFGAAMLAVKGATKTGVGYIIAIVPEKFNSTIKSFTPDIVSIPVPSQNRSHFSKEDLKFILNSNIIKKQDVIILGNGIDQNEDTIEFVKEFLLNIPNTIVLDADGINIIARDRNLLNKIKGRNNIIITPHLLEFSRILDTDISEVLSKPFSYGKKFVEEFKINLVLKDNVEYIFFYDGEIWIYDGNTTLLARAGTGDILAGLIGGNVAFTKNIKEGVKLAIVMLGEISKRWNDNILYPSPLDLI